MALVIAALLAFLFCVSTVASSDDGAPGVNPQNVHDLKIELEAEKLKRLQLEVRVDTLIKEISGTHTGGTGHANPIGFTAGVSRSKTTFTFDEKIIYDTVITNVGNNYDSTTGYFTAPVHGIYNFFFKTLVEGDHMLNMDLVVNSGARVVSAETYGTVTRDASGSASCAIVLAVGDKVFIRGRLHYASHMFGNNWNTFSGFLVRKM